MVSVAPPVDFGTRFWFQKQESHSGDILQLLVPGKAWPVCCALALAEGWMIQSAMHGSSSSWQSRISSRVLSQYWQKEREARIARRKDQLTFGIYKYHLSYDFSHSKSEQQEIELLKIASDEFWRRIKSKRNSTFTLLLPLPLQSLLSNIFWFSKKCSK